MGNNYIDKKELKEELEKCLDSDKVSDKLARMFYLIAKRYASAYVINWEDKEDMIQKSVEFLIKYFRNIDVHLDFFSYITQTCKYAFYQFFNSENSYKRFITERLTRASIEFEKKYKNK